MNKSSLTNTTVVTGDDVLCRVPPYTGPLVSLSTLGGGSGGGSYNDGPIRQLISQHTAAIATKAATTDLTNGLAGKQNTIQAGDLSISATSGLQTALDAKVDDSQVLTNVPANALFTDTVTNQINQITRLQSALDAKATTTALTTALAGKQDVIADGDLTIPKTNGLQTALDAKVTTAALATALGRARL